MNKKNIIAIIAIVVLLFIAGLSVGIFLYDSGETEAVDGNQIVDENQNNDENQVDGSQVEGNDQSSEDNEQSENIDSQEPVENPDAGDENITTSDNQVADGTENNNAENNDEIVDNETTNNDEVVNNVGVTTDTNVNDVGETTITRVEEQERLVSKDFWDWWKPVEVEIIPTAIGVKVPQITVKKAAITGVGGDELVYAGQDITYVIAVTNNGENTVENIEWCTHKENNDYTFQMGHVIRDSKTGRYVSNN